jgi:hypothetical protein
MPASLVCKRLRQRLADARIYVGLWSGTDLDQRRRKRFEESDANGIFTSLVQAEREIAAQVQAAHPPLHPLPEDSDALTATT